MMKTQINIQDQFLNRIRRDRSRVIVELTTGRKIEGVILGFDNFCLILRGEADQEVFRLEETGRVVLNNRLITEVSGKHGIL